MERLNFIAEQRLLRMVSTAFEDPAVRREFENWYKKTNGRTYVWKYLNESGEDYD